MPEMRRIDMDAILAQRNGTHRPRLGVVYPWQSPFFYTRCAESLLHLRHPDGCDVDFFRGSGWSPAVRHINGCEQAYAWGSDFIVIVGSDQLYDADLLCRLMARMEEGYDAVACMLPTRGFLAWNHGMKPFGKVAWRFKSSTKGIGTVVRQYHGQSIDGDMLELINPEEGDMQKCHFVGSGVIMFRREHLDSLAKPWFFETINAETQQRWASMDTRFSFRLQCEAGATLWVDTTIKVKHLHIFAIDETFSERFADWAMPSPDVDMDICRYLPTGMPSSTMPDEARRVTPQEILPPSFFDNYRANYATMTYAEHQQAYSIIERVYPDQSCYNRAAVAAFLETLMAHGVFPFILEIGGWKGELARDMLTQFSDMRGWHNVEICREAKEKNICTDSRYTYDTMSDFFWKVRPGWIRMCNTLVLSHVVEHMRLDDFAGTIAHCAANGIDYLYLDIPHITEDSHKAWAGWANTHVLEGGWNDLETILSKHGYAPLTVNSAATLTPRWYASRRGCVVLHMEEQHAHVTA